MGRMQMELGDTQGHRVPGEGVTGHTNPGHSIKLLVSVDLDTHGDLSGRWQSSVLRNEGFL